MSRSNFLFQKLHLYAVSVASLTFVLLLMGGLVHNTRSSLACPDWPLCFGQVMPKMEGGVLVEHSHRMVATAIGFLTIGLAVALWLRREARLRALGIVAVLAVSLQGVLGGITVLYRLPTWVSTTHLGLSMLFFALLIFLSLRLSPKRIAALPANVATAALIGAVVVYLQLIVGAFMRHAGAGLACVDWPLCRGELFPGDNAYLHLHMFHRLLGLVVLAVVAWVVALAWRPTAGRLSLRLVLVALPLLVLVQIVLGILSITTFLGVIPVTAHLGVAALIFAGLVVLSVVARGTGSDESAAAR